MSLANGILTAISEFESGSVMSLLVTSCCTSWEVSVLMYSLVYRSVSDFRQSWKSELARMSYVSKLRPRRTSSSLFIFLLSFQIRLVHDLSFGYR